MDVVEVSLVEEVRGGRGGVSLWVLRRCDGGKGRGGPPC